MTDSDWRFQNDQSMASNYLIVMAISFGLIDAGFNDDGNYIESCIRLRFRNEKPYCYDCIVDSFEATRIIPSVTSHNAGIFTIESFQNAHRLKEICLSDSICTDIALLDGKYCQTEDPVDAEQQLQTRRKNEKYVVTTTSNAMVYKPPKAQDHLESSYCISSTRLGNLQYCFDCLTQLGSTALVSGNKSHIFHLISSNSEEEVQFTCLGASKCLTLKLIGNKI